VPPSERNLVWIDLEMTGLDPDRCHILEIATIVTDEDLRVLAEGPDLVVHADEEALGTLSAWSREHFGASGLLDRVRASTVSTAEAEARTLAFLAEHVAPRSSPICGNSVHMDRQFLWRRMRRLHDYFHYRNVDVSTLKELVRRWYPDRYAPPPKAESHVALQDVRESIEELRYYRRTFLR
jgi:oligoribonuclease